MQTFSLHRKGIYVRMVVTFEFYELQIVVRKTVRSEIDTMNPIS